jgi:hypothetical protein
MSITTTEALPLTLMSGPMDSTRWRTQAQGEPRIT